MIDWFLFVVTEFLWWAGKWMLSTQNILMKTVLMKDFSKLNHHMLTSFRIFELSGQHYDMLTKMHFVDICFCLKHHEHKTLWQDLRKSNNKNKLWQAFDI